MKLRTLGLCLAFLAMRNAQANEGYLAFQGQFGRLLYQTDKSYKTSYGGWLLGGDEDTRGGAGGYKQMSAYSSPIYGDVSLWAAGPMVFWVPQFKSDDVVVHIGGMFGGGLIQSSSVSKQKFFWFVEPTVMLAFKLTAFFGIGVGTSFRYVPNFSGDESVLDAVRYTFSSNLSFILGDF